MLIQVLALLLQSRKCRAGVSNCICPAIFAPVCGIDGVTYSNKCRAICNGMMEFKCENECKKCGKGDHLALASNIAHIVIVDAGCANCGLSKQGDITCCGNGGSWVGKCGRVGDAEFEHTWIEGLRACATASLTTTKKLMTTGGECAWSVHRSRAPLN